MLMHTEMRRFDKIPLEVPLFRSNDQTAMWLRLVHLLVSGMLKKKTIMAIHMKYSDQQRNTEAGSL